jgi:hypothetical protein
MLHRVVWQTGLIALMMEAVNSSETSFNIYQTTRCNIPEDSHLKIGAVRVSQWNSRAVGTRFEFRQWIGYPERSVAFLSLFK